MELARAQSVWRQALQLRQHSVADAEVCRARLWERERAGSVSDGRLSIFDAFRARFEPVTELCPTEHIVLDTSRPVQESLRVLRARLDTWPLGFRS